MNADSIIRYNTLLLVLAAGCCDSITFISANELFSAHVTGNFVIFAYDIIKGADFFTWIRLLTFPVFLAAVVTGGWLEKVSDNKYKIIKFESGLLIFGGLISMMVALLHVRSVNLNFEIALLVVFAMGLQNAFGKLLSNQVYGPTTVMTGNVTQVALRLFEYLSGKKRSCFDGGPKAGCHCNCWLFMWLSDRRYCRNAVWAGGDTYSRLFIAFCP